MNRWINQIDKNTEEFQRLFGALTEGQLNWKPNSGTWSIAQNIEHLMVINQTYFPIFLDLKSGKYKTPFLAKFGFIVSFFGKFILNSVNPDRKKKIKTFPIWEPSKSEISSDILSKFSSHQEKLKREIEALRQLIEKGAIISSPANKHIVYKLETAFDIIVNHEQRHLEQAKEVLVVLEN